MTARRRPPGGARLVRGLARGLLALFYRRVEVVGAERVPADGPLIVIANHQNALVDPMLLLAAIPRPLVPLAKAPLFRHPIIAPFLRLAGAIPVARRQDAGGGPVSNDDMFRAAGDALAAGGALAIFPEGVSQPEPALMPLRTGTARIVLAAPADAAAITVLPVGLVFHEPSRFRTGWALVLMGPPVDTADCVALAVSDREAAVRRLTDRLADALRHLVVEVGDRQTLHLVTAAEAIWLAENPAQARDAAARGEWRRRAAAANRYLSAREPERLRALRAEVERYAADLDASGLADMHLPGAFPARVVLRYAVVEGAALLVGLPFALWGLANHAVPYWLTAAAARVARPEPDVEATVKLAAGVVLYPLCWAVEGWTAWRLGGGWLLAAFAAGLAPSGFFALAWAERLGKVARDTRAWLAFLADRDVGRHLAERRRQIMRELDALVALVPAQAFGETRS